MIDLDELERLCEEALPEPWHCPEWHDLVIRSDSNRKLVVALRNAATKLIAMARRYQTKREMDFESTPLRYIAEDDDEIERLRLAHHASYDAAIDAAMQEQKP